MKAAFGSSDARRRSFSISLAAPRLLEALQALPTVAIVQAILEVLLAVPPIGEPPCPTARRVEAGGAQQGGELAWGVHHTAGAIELDLPWRGRQLGERLQPHIIGGVGRLLSPGHHSGDTRGLEHAANLAQSTRRIGQVEEHEGRYNDVSGPIDQRYVMSVHACEWGLVALPRNPQHLERAIGAHSGGSTAR